MERGYFREEINEKRYDTAIEKAKKREPFIKQFEEWRDIQG
jgi:hypothetical protein